MNSDYKKGLVWFRLFDDVRDSLLAMGPCEGEAGRFCECHFDGTRGGATPGCAALVPDLCFVAVQKVTGVGCALWFRYKNNEWERANIDAPVPPSLETARQLVIVANGCKQRLAARENRPA